VKVCRAAQADRLRPADRRARGPSTGCPPRTPRYLRIKGYLVVRRNQVRAHIDVARYPTDVGSLMPQTCSGVSTITILTSEAPKQRVSPPSSLGSWPTRALRTLGRSSSFATTKAWIVAGPTGGM
jgi:hypothetical protein